MRAPVNSIRVALGPRSYSILVGAGLLGRLGPLLRSRTPVRSLWLVADARVARLHLQPVAASLRRA